MSDVGFLQAIQITYVNVAPTNVTYNDTEERRAIKQIVLVAYGLADDYRRLTSTNPNDRLVRHTASNLRGGVEAYAANNALIQSGDLGADSAAAPKTQKVVRAMTTNQGPSPHFVVTRKGDLIVGPSIDGTTSVVPDFQGSAVFIAVEGALLMPREDHAVRRFDRIFEAPYTLIQATTLATLVNKLLVACGATLPRVFNETLTPSDSGFTHRRADVLPDVLQTNFRTTDWELPIPGVTLDYAKSTPSSFFNLVSAQGPYDLATQIWMPANAPPVRAGREEARTAIGQVDTAAAESAYMGAYATIAAEERADEMQRQVRSQIFVQRHRVAHNDADSASSDAASVSEVGSSALLPTEVPANLGPHTYDFTTGLWGDNKAV